MTTEIIYITQYHQDFQTIKDNTINEYGNNCIICNTTENLEITTILPEDIYLELSHETWNNIILCKSCKSKLDYKNQENPNGFKNMISLIKQEYANKIQWLKNL